MKNFCILVAISFFLFFQCTSSVNDSDEFKNTLTTDTLYIVDTLYVEKIVKVETIKEVIKPQICNTNVINLKEYDKSKTGNYVLKSINGRTEINLTSDYTDEFGNLTLTINSNQMYNVAVISTPTGVIVDGFYGLVPTQSLKYGINTIRFNNLRSLTAIKIILS